MTATQKHTYPTVVRATGDEPDILISTVGVDRDGDVLQPEGLIKEPYIRNPVVLFGHRHDQLPVAATTALDVEAGRGVRARFRWLKGDEFADRVRNAFDQGVLRAASVGFIPHESSPRAGGRGLHFTKWELTEWSLVCVGSNPGAVRALKGLGLWDEDVALELSDTPADGIVLELDDDPIADAKRYIAAQAAKAAIDVLRAHGLAGDPLLDPATRHHMQDVMRGVIRDSIGAIVREAAGTAIARLRGRVD